MTGPRLISGLPEGLQREAARLYWQAFGGKLGPVLGPDALALRFLERALSPAHCISALSAEGRLLGIAGFKTPEGSFAGGRAGDMRRVYGPIGRLWREALLRLLGGEVDNDRFLIDGICVAPEARGQGIGTALVAALCDEARRRGYDYIRLDVVDTNVRARALYERLGFQAVRTDRIGWLHHVFGFRTAMVMVRPLLSD